MIDTRKIESIVSLLNKEWSACSKDIEKKDCAPLIYDAMCEIDEAIIILVEKISNCVKAQSICSMYGASTLSSVHGAVVKRKNI